MTGIMDTKNKIITASVKCGSENEIIQHVAWHTSLTVYTLRPDGWLFTMLVLRIQFMSERVVEAMKRVAFSFHFKKFFVHEARIYRSQTYDELKMQA